jgi:hypothetical protein
MEVISTSKFHVVMHHRVTKYLGSLVKNNNLMKNVKKTNLIDPNPPSANAKCECFPKTPQNNALNPLSSREYSKLPLLA